MPPPPNTIQPAHRLHAGEHEDVVADLELAGRATLPRRATISMFEVALAREVEADAGVEEVLVAVLNPVAAGLRKHERANPLQPEILAAARIEVDLAVAPGAGEAGPEDRTPYPSGNRDRSARPARSLWKRRFSNS